MLHPSPVALRRLDRRLRTHQVGVARSPQQVVELGLRAAQVCFRRIDFCLAYRPCRLDRHVRLSNLRLGDTEFDLRHVIIGLSVDEIGGDRMDRLRLLEASGRRVICLLGGDDLLACSEVFPRAVALVGV